MAANSNELIASNLLDKNKNRNNTSKNIIVPIYNDLERMTFPSNGSYNAHRIPREKQRTVLYQLCGYEFK